MTERRKPQDDMSEMSDLDYSDREPEENEVEDLWNYYSALRRADRLDYDRILAALRRQVAFVKQGLDVETEKTRLDDLKREVARFDIAIRGWDAKLTKLKPFKEALDKKHKEAEETAKKVQSNGVPQA